MVPVTCKLTPSIRADCTAPPSTNGRKTARKYPVLLCDVLMAFSSSSCASYEQETPVSPFHHSAWSAFNPSALTYHLLALRLPMLRMPAPACAKLVSDRCCCCGACHVLARRAGCRCPRTPPGPARVPH